MPSAFRLPCLLRCLFAVAAVGGGHAFGSVIITVPGLPVIRPKANTVYPEALTPSGRVVARLSTTTGYSSPFTWKDGVTNDLTPPGGSLGNVHAINDSDWIVGSYYLPFRDFTVEPPPPNTFPSSPILYTWHDGTVRAMRIAVSVASIARIDSEGRAFGVLNDSAFDLGDSLNRNAFVYGSSQLLSLRPPASAPGWSSITAVNPASQVIGTFTVGAGEPRAYAWDRGQSVDLTPAGARTSVANAINASGQVVGSYVTSPDDSPSLRTRHAFTWKDSALIPLADGEGIDAMLINDTGLIVGRDARSRSYVWRDNVRQTLTDGPVDEVNLISPEGIIAGTTGHEQTGLFFWREGVTTMVQTPSGARTFHVEAIDPSGRLFGSYFTPIRNSIFRHPQAFTWKDGVFTSLSIDPDDSAPEGSSRFTLIHPSGRALGSRNRDSVPGIIPFVWRNGASLELRGPAHSPGALCRANAMNSSGDIVGVYFESSALSSPFHACVWRDGSGEATDLFPSTGGSSSQASFINDAGQIVGTITAANGDSSTFFMEADGSWQNITPPVAPPMPTPTPTPAPTATPWPTATPNPTATPTASPRPPTDHRDRVAPVVRVNGSPQRTTPLSFAILSGRATDNRAVKRVEVAVGQEAFKRVNGRPGNWYQMIDLAPGRTVVRVRAVDTSGNRSAVKTVVFLVP